MTSHAAFGYLADRYGLEQIAVTGLTPEAEPSARDLERLVDEIREHDATTVFVETLVSPRLAETVAREADVETATLDPLEGLTEEDAEAGADYFSVMRENLRTLREALGCASARAPRRDLRVRGRADGLHGPRSGDRTGRVRRHRGPERRREDHPAPARARARAA